MASASRGGSSRWAEDLVHLNQGSIYPALLRLQQKGWISATWGASKKNRRAKFYALTPAGRTQLDIEVKNWQRTTTLVGRFLEVISC